MKLPKHHLSVRVPWHDNKWNGCFCKDPRNNASCMFLPRMQSKDVEQEEQYSNEPLIELLSGYRPPCISEKVSFMSDKDINIKAKHPYKDTNEKYKHFEETPLTHHSYSFSVIPFRWMLKDKKNKTSEKADAFALEYDPAKEPDLGFDDSWVQNHENQKNILDSFISAIVPDKSLVFIYAKNIPLIEFKDRILIGVGRVTKIGDIKQYGSSGFVVQRISPISVLL